MTSREGSHDTAWIRDRDRTRRRRLGASSGLATQACPSAGATLQILAVNGTSSSGQLVRVKGTLLSGSCNDTGGALLTSYGGAGGELVDCGPPNQAGAPAPCTTKVNLKPGTWKHEIIGQYPTLNKPGGATSTQHQYVNNRLVGGSGNNLIYWTIPKWIGRVSSNADTGTGTLRQAITDANTVLSNQDAEPYLIELADTLANVTISPAQSLPNLARNRVTIDLTDNGGDNGVTIDFSGVSELSCGNWTILSSHNNLIRFTMQNVKKTGCDLLRVNDGDDNVFDGLTLTNTLPSGSTGQHRVAFDNGAGGSLLYRTAASPQVLASGANVIKNSLISGGPARLGDIGVEVEGLSFVRLEYNVIENNLKGGVRLFGAATAEALYNWIRSNGPTTSPQTSGILVTPTSTVNSGTLIATRNLIEDHGRGIRARCRANLTADGLVSKDNDSTGLTLSSVDQDNCPAASNQRPTAIVRGSNISNNRFDGLVAEGRIFPGIGPDGSSFGESADHATSPGRNAFTKNNTAGTADRRNFNNSSGKNAGNFQPQQLRAVNNQWEHGGTAATCAAGTCLCGTLTQPSNVCSAGCTAPICALDIWNDRPGATTVFGPPMMYRAAAPAATEVYPSVGQTIGSLQWIIGSDFNAIEGEAVAGNTCNPTNGNCVELWLDTSGPLATLAPLGDAPGVLVVGTPINCNQPTYYHVNKLDSSGSEFPSDAVVSWCTNP